MSIDGTEKRGRGRPQVDSSAIHMRLPDELLQQIVEWGERQNPPLKRTKAIRAILEKYFSLVG